MIYNKTRRFLAPLLSTHIALRKLFKNYDSCFEIYGYYIDDGKSEFKGDLFIHCKPLDDDWQEYIEAINVRYIEFDFYRNDILLVLNLYELFVDYNLNSYVITREDVDNIYLNFLDSKYSKMYKSIHIRSMFSSYQKEYISSFQVNLGLLPVIEPYDVGVLSGTLINEKSNFKYYRNLVKEELEERFGELDFSKIEEYDSLLDLKNESIKSDDFLQHSETILVLN